MAERVRVKCPACREVFEPRDILRTRCAEEIENDRRSRQMYAALTPRMRVAVSFLMECMTNKQIATAMGTSEQMVKNILEEAYERWNLGGRMDIALKVADHPLLRARLARLRRRRTGR